MKTWMNPSPVYAADGDGGEGGDQGGGGDNKKVEGAGDDKGGNQQQDDKSGAGDKGDGKGDGKDKSGSFLSGADDLTDQKVTAPADFPDDWRDKVAGDNKDFRQHLDRYKSFAEYAKAGYEAQRKIGAGKHLVNDEPMPDAEKEPEKAKEWRKARNIPDDPTGYVIPESVKNFVTDADKPRLAEFTDHMHKNNVPASAAGAALEYYFQADAAAKEAIAAADKADAADVEEALRGEWGADFKGFSVVAKKFAEEITPGINWFEARLGDGRLLGSIPEFVKAVADLGRERYGDVSLAGSENTAKTMARKEELEKMMRDKPDEYRADPKLSKEYEQIMDAELKAQGRSGGPTHSPKQ